MSAPALRLAEMSAGYGQLQVLHAVSLEVSSGEIVGLLGANGAGKTTTLRAISGLLKHSGMIQFRGVAPRRFVPEAIVRLGVATIPEGRGTFPNLTVEENLRAGAITHAKSVGSEDLARWLDYFPRLAERKRQLAGTLSGGEQQMLAVARAMMSRPRLLLLDEPSMGLAPKITRALFDQLVAINATEGTAMLLVEQNANLALQIAHRAYVLERGSVSSTGAAADLRDDPSIRKAYLHA